MSYVWFSRAYLGMVSIFTMVEAQLTWLQDPRFLTHLAILNPS